MTIYRRFIPLYLFLLVIASEGMAEEGLLRFAPPARTNFTVQSVSARSQYLGDRLLGIDSTFRTQSCVLEKAGNGWRLQSTLTQCAMRRDSSYSDSLFAQLMKGLKTSLQIDSLGGASEIDGFQRLSGRIAAVKDTAMSRQLKEILNPELMAAKEVDEWNMWMSRLVGRPFRVGAVTNVTDDVSLPDDAQLLSFELSFLLDTLSYEGKLYGRLMTYIDTDPLRLSKTTNRSPHRMAEIFNMPDSAITILSEPMSDFRQTSEIIFEVKTLLLASKKTDREIMLLQSNEPGRAVFSSIVETTVENYSYDNK